MSDAFDVLSRLPAEHHETFIDKLFRKHNGTKLKTHEECTALFGALWTLKRSCRKFTFTCDRVNNRHSHVAWMLIADVATNS